MPSRTIRPTQAPVVTPYTYDVGTQESFAPETITASWDGSSAPGAFLATVSFYDPSGVLIARAFPETSVKAGSSAEVSYYPFRRRAAAAAGVGFPRNMGELGFAFSSSQSFGLTCPVTFENAEAGDGILIMAQAPSKRAALATPARPQSVSDSALNTYSLLAASRFEANPPNVNQGMSVAWFWCPASQAPLVAGSANIAVTWSGAVFDRAVWAWLVRHDDGALTPQLLAVTADNDAAVFAQGFVSLTSPGWTPTRDNGFAFAYITAAGPTGVGSFSGLPGYIGYFQAQARGGGSVRQAYLCEQQTHGNDVFLVVSSGAPQYELDLGTLPAGVAVPTFNGVGQQYSAGTNVWKGITLWAID